MKLAVPVTSTNLVDSHFGHCESYTLFSINDSGEISERKKLESPAGCGCKSGIASSLASEGVTVMLAGGIGGGAINVLNQHGIEVIRGCSGNAEEVVKLYVRGQVSDSGKTCSEHGHSHEHGHNNDHGHSCNHHQ